jgi:hypothetical protein
MTKIPRSRVSRRHHCIRVFGVISFSIPWKKIYAQRFYNTKIMKIISFSILFAILTVASAGSLRNLYQEEDAQHQHPVAVQVPSSDASTIQQDNHITQATYDKGVGARRHLFFEGADTLGPFELITESLARIFIAILDYLILGPLFYYWDIANGGYNFYPELNECLLGPPPFEQCLIDNDLKR